MTFCSYYLKAYLSGDIYEDKIELLYQPGTFHSYLIQFSEDMKIHIQCIMFDAIGLQFFING